jgi:muramoyltetrapeptide carboxypeptidase
MIRTAFQAPFLVPGARVGIIAPSSPFNAEELKHGLSLLSSRYSVSHAPSLFDRQGYLAGSDARRLAELQSAIDDPDLDAIFAVRGGYGATRLLDGLDVSALARRPKLLLGFSDITALHALWSQRSVGSVHGPMVAAVGRAAKLSSGA